MKEDPVAQAHIDLFLQSASNFAQAAPLAGSRA
jgi:hypothetical protein